MAFSEILSAFCPAPDAARSATSTAGLFVSGSESSVPLRLRSISSTVHCDSSFADTTETFAFVSDEDVSAVFKFPLPPRAAVYKLVATIGDRTITTEVKPRQQAQQEFDQATSQGHTAVMAKQESSTQIFTLELGNLESMTEAIVEVSYLHVLDSVGGALEYVHTATWTPPYLGSAGDQQRGEAVAAQENPRFASKVAYSLAYDILLLSSRGIRSVDSAEGQVQLKDEVVEGVAAKRVTVSDSVADPSKDLTLMVELDSIDSGLRTATTADGYGLVTLQQCERAATTPDAQPVTKTVALATFVPANVEIASSKESTTINQEIVMIIDCSGSMGGDPIKQAREAAIYFIKDLPVGRKLLFNIVVFGSNHIIWSPSGCQEFTEQSMNDAVTWINDKVEANLGGTEILETFKSVYNMPIKTGYTRQIIFLTDGGISGSEEDSVFKLVSQNTPGIPGKLQASIQNLKDKVLRRTSSTAGSENAKTGPAIPAVLCLGIGHGVHRGLLDGCASRTGGVAQYVVGDESITRKVAFLKKVALAGPAAIQDARVACGGAVARIAPHVLPKRLFPGEPVHVLLELQKYDDLNDVNVQLTGNKGDGSSFNLTLPLKDIKPVKGDAYAVLHGMCIVSGLSEGRSALHCNPDGSMLHTQPTEDQVKAAVTEIAVQEHLVTRYTAAVGVMIQKNPLDPGQVKKVEVPLATPHGADLFKENTVPFSFGGIMPQARAAPRSMMMFAKASPMMSSMAAPPSRSSGGGLFGLAFGGARSTQSSGFGMAFGAAPQAVPVAAFGAPAPCFAMPSCAAMPPPPAPGSMAADSSSPMADECEEVAEKCEAASAPRRSNKKMVKEMADMDEDNNGPMTWHPDNDVVTKRSTSDVLNLLNLKRGVDGYWAASNTDNDEVLSAVTSQVKGDPAAAKDAARSGKPAFLSADQWLTVLALAFLRKHCAADRSIWEGMESKAMSWLQAAWPQGEKSLGATVLAAQKFV